MTTTLSRSKDKIKILLLEGISHTASDALQSAGYTNVERLAGALHGADLRKALSGVSMVGIRSRTQLTAEALDGQRSVIAVGCFSVGTNQVDLNAARDMGVPVFNAPFSNTRSVAELTVAEIVMLYRRIFPEVDGGPPRRLGQGGGRRHGSPRQDPGHRRLWQHRQPDGGAGRSDGHAGDLLRSHRQAPARQRDANRDACRASRAKRRGEPARPRDAADQGHDRRGRTARHEAGVLSHQQRAGHGSGYRSACGSLARQASGGRGGRCFPGRARLEQREVRVLRCRGWTT